MFSEKELSTLKRFFQLIDKFVYFHRSKFIGNVSQQASEEYAFRRSPSTQTSARSSMNQNGSELPDEIRTIVKEDTVKKICTTKKLQTSQQTMF